MRQSKVIRNDARGSESKRVGIRYLASSLSERGLLG